MLVAFFTILLSFFFSLFSTATLSYIALATPIGPWIEMALVLAGSIIIRAFCHRLLVTTQQRTLAYATAAGGIGGAVAIACAFSFGTLYFLDPVVFTMWLNSPLEFCALLAGLVVAAGSFGFLIVHYFERTFLADPAMIFPIGQMVYAMIALEDQFKKSVQLAAGAASAFTYGIVTFIAPARLTLLPTLQWGIFTIPHVTTRTDMIPLFWAIGFTTGHVIAIPLMVAIIARILVINPVHSLFFNQLSYTSYILAFGAGMAIQGALWGLRDLPTMVHKTAKKIFEYLSTRTLRRAQGERKKTKHNQNFETACGDPSSSLRTEGVPRFMVSLSNHEPFERNSKSTLYSIILLLLPITFLTMFSFTFATQLYLLFFTTVCTYQLLIIAGTLGIAPLGRFATFTLIPGILLFKLSALQITLLAAFVEIAGIVAVDSMFGQKVAQLGSFNRSIMRRYQWLGLITSALAVGIIFWLLITHFGLGSPELIAARAQGRALLIHAFNFNYMVMLLGLIFSFALKCSGINPTLVFGGLLMGLDTSLLLVTGGLSTYLVQEKEEQYPFWSGVYATNSLWICIKMLW